MSLRTMCLPVARAKGRLYAEVALPPAVHEMTRRDTEYLADLIEDARMQLVFAEPDPDSGEPASTVVLYHGLLVHGLLHLKVPGARRLAHYRAQTRVQRHLGHFGIIVPELGSSCLHEGVERTALGRGMELCYLAYSWAVLIMLVSIPFHTHLVGALGFLLALLVCALVILTIFAIGILSGLTGRSAGQLVIYRDGTNSSMSRRQRRAHHDART